MYDFDELIDRRNSNSNKWAGARKRLTPEQYAADPLPMWVADMDFRIAQPIRDAIQRELDHGIFGYGSTPDSYVDAVMQWHARRYGWQTKAEWLTQSPGVVNAINMAMQAFSQPGDHVATLTPVYVHFHHDVVINGRRLIQVPLQLEGGRYRFDPHAFESSLPTETKLFILCHPHNPTGNVWTPAELRTMAEICERRGIVVISDEVHADFVFGRRHVPYASLDERMAQHSITCTAPSKTFNLAGLQCANVFIPNDRLRAAFRAQCEKSGLTLNNTIGTAACEAAYRYGEPWADAMLNYIQGNHAHFAAGVVERNLPFAVTPTESLYLAWLDFRRLGLDDVALNDFLLRRARVWLDRGTKFGEGGSGFMRINLGCPRAIIDEALDRLSNALRDHGVPVAEMEQEI
ncbi:aminotransferase, class I and II [Caballeronia calidae]|uniref:cysteine-S-conjugate beta-lyase n=1 Tax=Caballeronia calidae TaxID=1777139 RepID=A0A158E984_9BURK|nr:MalY/PatB family protein [Caballeronia calidae]SAL02956.1 aminotransferase, class I and II [Caballeronia calidae]